MSSDDPDASDASVYTALSVGRCIVVEVLQRTSLAYTRAMDNAKVRPHDAPEVTEGILGQFNPFEVPYWAGATVLAGVASSQKMFNGIQLDRRLLA
ncbi:hypothetical protein CGMCC3_g15874 [Colletotrichum fructicola]|uniref:Uncharacterized protein n=1 Tax=Colletotrichum fructicola (strain Nara gc5) TaxID=1213859 RepID=L2G8H0_COLFN|nr:uncharacterized protein CGMCC3_g15874 [Colletotrichum fructicola]KAE9568016.1 hypothetical protein CGMCC3_g15874 [Colletotrichum fructicola]KAF4418789.1 hypothetical protein CFRS1_v014925 [Colletotrichum fructicola]KAF4473938.1 hypothetical protein CGGC5_v016978 [Colletotrichum fructicola Nara gc5]